MDKALNAERLKSLVPFDAISESHHADVLRKAEVLSLTKGSILFKRGEASGNLHWLLEGSVDLADAEFNITTVAADEKRARSPLDNQQPHAVTAVTTVPCKAMVLSKDYLDLVLTWDEAGNYMVTDLSDDIDDEVDANDWMSTLLQSSLFAQVPPANIQQLFLRFEEVHVPAGETVVKQGDPGDYFYVIKSGRAEITRRMSSGGELKTLKLAEIDPGDVFGEDALIGNAPRNATVAMLEEGTLMRLGGDDFKDLLEAPVLEYTTFEDVKGMMADAAAPVELIDVRLPLEFKQGHIPGARGVPLHALRQSLDELDRNVTYITSCDGGRRSALAAYILSEHGFTALVLKDPPELATA